MVAFINQKYDPLSIKVIFEDFMKIDMSKIFDNQPFSLIGNFPYNISSQIVFKMIENRMLVPEMVGMFQLEMAERVVAKPGGIGPLRLLDGPLRGLPLRRIDPHDLGVKLLRHRVLVDVKRADGDVVRRLILPPRGIAHAERPGRQQHHLAAGFGLDNG